MPEDDWTDTPEWRAYARRVRRELIPKMSESSVIMSLLTESKPDVKFAVELGMAVLLDKPIIAVVSPGVKVPNKLVLVADEIVEVDWRNTDEGAQRRMAEAIARVVGVLPE